jgi:hypothetical protein
MNASDQAQMKKLQAHARAMTIAAKHRDSALRAIEEIIARCDDARAIRLEVQNVIADCREKVRQGVTA